MLENLPLFRLIILLILATMLDLVLVTAGASGMSGERQKLGRYAGMTGSIFSALSLLFGSRHGVLDANVPETFVGDVTFTRIDGKPLPLSRFAGQTLLIVNTASRCLLKEQFNDLQSLYTDLEDQGFVVLGVPSNDFGSQEPGNDGEIDEIYRSSLNVTFPLTGKVSTRGSAIHPFFDRVRSIAGSHALPKWNFYKYVITRNGHLAAWFSTPIRPTSKLMRQTIESNLHMDAAALVRGPSQGHIGKS